MCVFVCARARLLGDWYTILSSLSIEGNLASGQVQVLQDRKKAGTWSGAPSLEDSVEYLLTLRKTDQMLLIQSYCMFQASQLGKFLEKG